MSHHRKMLPLLNDFFISLSWFTAPHMTSYRSSNFPLLPHVLVCPFSLDETGSKLVDLDCFCQLIAIQRECYTHTLTQRGSYVWKCMCACRGWRAFVSFLTELRTFLNPLDSPLHMNGTLIVLSKLQRCFVTATIAASFRQFPASACGQCGLNVMCSAGC